MKIFRNYYARRKMAYGALIFAMLVISSSYIREAFSHEVERIVIVAPPRSGSTALYSAILENWGGEDEVDYYLEPEELSTALHSNEPKVLVKLNLMTRWNYLEPTIEELLNRSDKIIFIKRDPRDVLISEFLYSTQAMNFIKNPQLYDKFMKRLRAKEKTPRKYNLLDLIEFREGLERASSPSWYQTRLWQNLAEDYEVLARLIEQYKNKALVIDYHEVNNELYAQVRSYLKLPVLPPKYLRTDKPKLMIRERREDIWKNWFTVADLKRFADLFAPVMRQLGYAEDWQLAPVQRINEGFSSEYVKSIINYKHDAEQEVETTEKN